MLGLSHRAGDRAGASGWSSSRRAGLDARLLLRHGSTAAEIALKMAFQYWQPARRGAAHRLRLRCATAYHGDTIGSVSVGGIDLFHSLYRPLLFDTLQAEPGRRRPTWSALLAEHGERAGRGDRGAARAGRGRDARAPRRATCARCASCATRHGVLLILRRGRHRLRPHRARCSPASTRASRPTCSASPRASPAATCRSPRRSPRERDLRGLPRRARGVPDLLPRPHLHGQPARLRGGARDARRLRARSARSSGCSRRSSCSAQLLEPVAAPPGGARGAPARLHGRHRAAPSYAAAPRAWATGSRSRRAARGAIIRPLGDVVVLMPPLAISDGRPAPPRRDHRRGDRRRDGARAASCRLSGRSAIRAGWARSTARSLAASSTHDAAVRSGSVCALRTPGRTSRPGSTTVRRCRIGSPSSGS